MNGCYVEKPIFLNRWKIAKCCHVKKRQRTFKALVALSRARLPAEHGSHPSQLHSRDVLCIPNQNRLEWPQHSAAQTTFKTVKEHGKEFVFSGGTPNAKSLTNSLRFSSGFILAPRDVVGVTCGGSDAKLSASALKQQLVLPIALSLPGIPPAMIWKNKRHRSLILMESPLSYTSQASKRKPD